MSEENQYSNLLPVIDKIQAAAVRTETDYVNEDGLLYCGLCHTPKQTVIHLNDGNKIVGTHRCKCQKEKSERLELEKKKQKEREHIEKLKRNSLIDKKFMSCTFNSVVETAQNSRQLKLCRRYAEKFDELFKKNQGLLLYGGVGTGKTHIACCIGNYLIERDNSVFAVSLAKYLQEENLYKNDREKEMFIRKVTSAKLFILDDLGTERETGYGLEFVYNVIDSRYRSEKPMIVTTNLTLDEMQNVPDVKRQRIYDRILEVCYPVEFRGPSWRLKEAANRFDDITKILEEE